MTSKVNFHTILIHFVVVGSLMLHCDNSNKQFKALVGKTCIQHLKWADNLSDYSLEKWNSWTSWNYYKPIWLMSIISHKCYIVTFFSVCLWKKTVFFTNMNYLTGKPYLDKMLPAITTPKIALELKIYL